MVHFFTANAGLNNGVVSMKFITNALLFVVIFGCMGAFIISNIYGESPAVLKARLPEMVKPLMPSTPIPPVTPSHEG